MNTKLQLRPSIGTPLPVPCVEHPYWGWLPIQGAAHTDEKYMNVTQRHYHVDPRFMDDDLLRRWTRRNDDPSRALALGIPAAECLGKPVTRQMLVQREMPAYPEDSYAWMPLLEAAYAGKRMRNLTCPHQGFSLRSCQPDPEGVLTCPGHGLRWNLLTGKLVPRTPLRPLTLVQRLRRLLHAS